VFEHRRSLLLLLPLLGLGIKAGGCGVEDRRVQEASAGSGNSLNAGGSSNVAGSANEAGTAQGGTNVAGAGRAGDAGEGAEGGAAEPAGGAGGVAGAGGDGEGEGGDAGDGASCIGVVPMDEPPLRYCSAGNCYCTDSAGRCFSQPQAADCCDADPICGEDGGLPGIDCSSSHPLIGDGGSRYCEPGYCLCVDADQCFAASAAAFCCPPESERQCLTN
jgi:hypothetical protein